MKVKVSMLIILVFALAFISCNRQEKTPTQVFEETVSGLSSGNAAAVWDNMSAGSRAKFKKKENFSAILKGALSVSDAREKIEKIELVDEKVDGDTAMLTVRYPSPEGEDGMKTREIKCVKENGEWKLDISEMVNEIMEA